MQHMTLARHHLKLMMEPKYRLTQLISSCQNDLWEAIEPIVHSCDVTVVRLNLQPAAMRPCYQ